MNKLFIFSLGALVLLRSCISASPADDVPPPLITLPVATVTNKTTTIDTEYPATIQGVVDLEIRPQVNGNLDRVFVDEGAYVKKGQPLFKINERPYREQLNTALANLHAQEATLLNAQIEVDKFTPLVANKVISDHQLKTAQATLRLAMANIEQAKAIVESAKINLGYTNVLAPVNGYIGRLHKKQGSLVSPTDLEALTTLSDIHEVHVYFSFSETDFIKFKNQYPGNTLEEKIKNLPSVSLLLADNELYEQPGKINMVDGQFDRFTSAITFRATFPNQHGVLRSGNTGRIRLPFQHTNALSVPQTSTVEIQDKIFVFRVDEQNKVSKSAIEVIGKSGNNYLVKSGVQSGDQIVLSGIDKLQEGQIIQPTKAPEKVASVNLN